MFNLLKHEIFSRRNAIIGWGIGLILFGAMYIAVYPSMAEEMAAIDLSDIAMYEAMGLEMSNFESYLSSAVVQYITIIMIVYAIISGTATLAGEEESGTLELLVSTPIPRWQIVTVKALALAIVTFLILAVAGAGNAAILAATEIDTAVTPLDLFLATLSGWPLTLAFTMIGLFLGALLPGRRTAAMTATVLFIASYFGNGLSGMVGSLEPLRPLSLFHYFDATAELFTEGVQAGDAALLLGVALVFCLLALISFQRRNITVGAWPWQRAAT